MKFFEAYEHMKMGEVVCRQIQDSFCARVRKLRIIENTFRAWNKHYDWAIAVQISIDDLEATDWEATK